MSSSRKKKVISKLFWDELKDQFSYIELTQNFPLPPGQLTILLVIYDQIGA